MSRAVIKLIVALGLTLSTVYAEERTFSLTLPGDILAEADKLPAPKFLGVATLSDGGEMPAYAVYSESGMLAPDEFALQTPDSLNVGRNIKAKYRDELVLYYFDGRWFAIPKNWQLVRAAIGANATSTISFAPPTGQSGYFTFHTNNGGCAMCGQGLASTFIKQADIDWVDGGMESNYHKTNPKIQSVELRPYTQGWRTTINGQNIDGLTYYNPDDYYAYSVEVSLPPAQKALATPILNLFLPPK